MKLEILNPYLKNLTPDYMHHLGLNSQMDLKKTFGDTKFVLMGGSRVRAEDLAKKAAKDLKLGIPDEEIKPIGNTERCLLFKVGPIISVSHGMGMPSALIFLHEITKLLQHAQCEDVTFIRVGTSGGLGIEPGTIVITKAALNGKLKEKFKPIILGKTYKYKTKLDQRLANDIFKERKKEKVIFGKTMGTDDFYEGQARLDGALPPVYTEEKREKFFNKAYKKGVRNIEMEAPAFAAFCLRAKIPAAVVCAVLLNRFEGDQPKSTREELVRFSEDAQSLVLRHIKQKLTKQ